MVFSIEDFTHPEIVNCEKLLNNQENGLLEVIVMDNGVGIKIEDQKRLFKLFGFLETT